MLRHIALKDMEELIGVCSESSDVAVRRYCWELLSRSLRQRSTDYHRDESFDSSLSSSGLEVVHSRQTGTQSRRREQKRLEQRERRRQPMNRALFTEHSTTAIPDARSGGAADLASSATCSVERTLAKYRKAFVSRQVGRGVPAASTPRAHGHHHQLSPARHTSTPQADRSVGCESSFGDRWNSFFSSITAASPPVQSTTPLMNRTGSEAKLYPSEGNSTLHPSHESGGWRESLQQELDKCRAELAVTQTTYAEELQKAQQHTQAERESLRHELDKCRGELAAAQTAQTEELLKAQQQTATVRESLQLALDECREELVAAQSSHSEELQKAQQHSEVERESLQQELDTCRAELAATKTTHAEELQKAQQHTQAERESLRHELDKCRGELAAAQTAQTEELLKAQQQTATVRESLQLALDECREELVAAKVAHAEELQSAQQYIEEEREECADLRNELNALRSVSLEANLLLHESMGRERLRFLRHAEVAELTAQRERGVSIMLQAALECSTDECVELTGRVAELNSRLQQQQTSTREAIHRLEGEFHTTSTHYQTLVSEGTQRAEKAERAARKYRSQRDEATEQSRKQAEMMETMENRVTELEEAQASKALAMRDEQRRLKDKLNEAEERLTGALQVEQSTSRSLQTLELQFESKKRISAETIAALRRQLKEKDEKLTVLAASSEEPLQRLRRQLVEERSRRSAVEEQLHQLKRRAKEAEEDALRELKREQLRPRVVTPKSDTTSASVSPQSVQHLQERAAQLTPRVQLSSLRSSTNVSPSLPPYPSALTAGSGGESHLPPAAVLLTTSTRSTPKVLHPQAAANGGADDELDVSGIAGGAGGDESGADDGTMGGRARGPSGNSSDGEEALMHLTPLEPVMGGMDSTALELLRYITQSRDDFVAQCGSLVRETASHAKLSAVTSHSSAA